MPSYDYKCIACDEEIETFLRLSDYTDEIACPRCGGMAIRIITKPILTCLSNKDRKWGTSLYRRDGDKVKRPKMPAHTPLKIGG